LHAPAFFGKGIADLRFHGSLGRFTFLIGRRAEVAIGNKVEGIHDWEVENTCHLCKMKPIRS